MTILRLLGQALSTESSPATASTHFLISEAPRKRALIELFRGGIMNDLV
jgi:hypothetical protein